MVRLAETACEDYCLRLDRGKIAAPTDRVGLAQRLRRDPPGGTRVDPNGSRVAG